MAADASLFHTQQLWRILNNVVCECSIRVFDCFCIKMKAFSAVEANALSRLTMIVIRVHHVQK